MQNKCVEISNGAVLCPSSTESINDIWPIWQAHVETTDQNYESWTMSNNFTLLCLDQGGQGIIQPTLTEVAPGQHTLAIL